MPLLPCLNPNVGGVLAGWSTNPATLGRWRDARRDNSSQGGVPMRQPQRGSRAEPGWIEMNETDGKTGIINIINLWITSFSIWRCRFFQTQRETSPQRNLGNLNLIPFRGGSKLDANLVRNKEIWWEPAVCKCILKKRDLPPAILEYQSPPCSNSQHQDYFILVGNPNRPLFVNLGRT